MATFLDIVFLEHFSNIFIILFIFVAVYAVLQFKKPLGGNKGIDALFAFVVAILFIFSSDAIEIVRYAIPWFIILVVIYVFLNIAKEAFGAVWVETIPQTFGTWTLIFTIIIALLAISHVIGQKAGPYLNDQNTSSLTQATSYARGDGNVASGSFQENLGATLFHPKVLGILAILFIMLFAALWIGKGP
ncbi:hypothetical protein JW930_00200 [Candidatus Woesearchaeota archaeon]|nr:hypothetical protein [Candidatus Woesearchaeota archaeon]